MQVSGEDTIVFRYYNAALWVTIAKMELLHRGYTSSPLLTICPRVSKYFGLLWTNGFLHFLQTVKAFNINVIQLFIFTGTKHKMCTYFATHPNKFIIASESQV